MQGRLCLPYFVHFLSLFKESCSAFDLTDHKVDVGVTNLESKALRKLHQLLVAVQTGQLISPLLVHIALANGPKAKKIGVENTLQTRNIRGQLGCCKINIPDAVTRVSDFIKRKHFLKHFGIDRFSKNGHVSARNREGTGGKGVKDGSSQRSKRVLHKPVSRRTHRLDVDSLCDRLRSS